MLEATQEKNDFNLKKPVLRERGLILQTTTCRQVLES